MEILAKNICDIIVSEVNAINDKVKGLNFLEILKINSIEKLSLLINEQKLPFNENFDTDKEIEKNILISMQYIAESLSISKKIIKYDSLFISLNETTNIDIHQDEKKYSSIALHKNNGISLPKKSVINFRLNKNTLLLEIQNKNIDQVLTKLKMI